MPRRPKKAVAAPATTAQSLGSLLKSARDIMRKDKGLNGDLDRLPMLTWVMFLKFLDDLELRREQEAKLAGKKFRAAIDRALPLAGLGRQPDRASPATNCSPSSTRTSASAPTASAAPGLFAYLRRLHEHATATTAAT